MSHSSLWHGACLLLLVLGLPGPGRAEGPHDPDHQTHPVDEVVVTATPLDRGSDELAVPVTVLGRDQVLSHLKSSLGETLASEPGMAATGFAPGASRPVIRGQDAVRVRVLENGIGAHDVSTVSPDHGVPVNPLTAQRVEVMRGPSTLRYGGGAIGGVVNALTNRVPRYLPDGPLEGELYAGYGFGLRGRDGAFVLEGAQGPVAWHLDGVRSKSGDYTAPDGLSGDVDNSELDAYSISGGAAWISDQGRLGFAASRFRNDYGIPEEDATIELWKNYWQFEGDWNAPVALVDSIRLRAATSNYEHDEVLPGVGTAATFDNDEWEGRLELLHRPVGPLTGALGFHLSRRDFEAGGEGEEYLDPTDTDFWALYAFEELPVSDVLALQFGARTEHADVQGTPAVGPKQTRSFHPLSGSVGVLFDATEHVSAGLTFSAMQRALDSVELYASGPHEATQTFEIGDPDLDEETSLSADLNLRGNWERLSGELNLFYIDYDDYTYGMLTGNTCDADGNCIPGPGQELDELFYVQDDATFYGGEFRSTVDILETLGGHLGADVQLDVVRGRLDHGNVPRQPPVRYGAGLHFSREGFDARLGFVRHREQKWQAQNETETSGYTNWNAFARYRIYDSAERTLDLGLTATNLLDERGRNSVNIRKDEVVLPGRIVRVALHGSF